jgi:hypothetical protein
MITAVFRVAGCGIVGICLAREGKQRHPNTSAAGLEDVILWGHQHWSESAIGGQLPYLKAVSSMRTRSLPFAKYVCAKAGGFLR